MNKSRTDLHNGRKAASIKRSIRARFAVILLIIVASLGIFHSLGLLGLDGGTAAQAQGETAKANLALNAGVWNDGQAAVWDVPIFDHFKIFGPKERADGHAPEQPIKFSHVTHVQKNQMDCQYCHWTVAKSPYAAIPEVSTCMGCHQWVSGREEAQKTEIQKIHGFFSQNQPIPWVKVHVMPDHVRFNHKRHVKAGVTCQSCHGQVPQMETVERVTSMKMGWCVTCHRAQGSSIDCNTCHH